MITANFMYNIGDIVYAKTAGHNQFQHPKKLMITEQIAIRCSGGTQLFYRVNGGTELFPEIMLTMEMPEYEQLPDQKDQAFERAVQYVKLLKKKEKNNE